MGWEERLLIAFITTPDDEVYEFEWRDFEKEINKKTSHYTFGDLDGTLVQDFGVGEVSIPIIAYISGDDYDKKAKSFEKSLSLKGNSVLDHPLYGIFDIVVEKIHRRDSLATAANQAVFVLTITETIIIETPETGTELKTGILASQESLIDVNSESFASGFNLSDIQDAISSASRITSYVNNLRSDFQNALNTVTEIQNAFEEIANSIINGIDDLLQSPFQLATALQNLTKLPSRLATSVKSRVDTYSKSYSALFKDPTSSVAGPVDVSGTPDIKNQRLEKQLLLTSIVSAISEVYLFPSNEGDEPETIEGAESIADDEKDFRTKSEATASASNMFSLFNDTQDFLDEQEKKSISDNLNNRFSVSDGVTDGIKGVTSQTSRFLVKLSFSLKQERIEILTRDRTIIDLAYQLYGSSDNETLDLLIQSNGLTGEEILMIPKGKEIRYYI